LGYAGSYAGMLPECSLRTGLVGRIFGEVASVPKMVKRCEDLLDWISVGERRKDSLDRMSTV
jgi:hypothetical protein